MNDTLTMKGEAKRSITTGTITRFLVDNPKADLAEVAKATRIPAATVRRHWDDACKATKVSKSKLRLDMANPPRVIKVSGMDVHYTPQDYDNEFMGGSYRVADLPDVYVYARLDDTRLESTYEINSYEINWGCCGSVQPEKFDRWVSLCAFVSAQVREMESKLDAKRQFAAAIESRKSEQA